MKSLIVRGLTSLLLLAVLTAAPLAWAQDAVPAAPTDLSTATASGTVQPIAAPAEAAAPSQSPAASMLSFSGGGLDLLKGIGAFVLVLLLLFLALKGLGRLGRFKGRRGRDAFFELRGIQALDNRKYLAAVEAEGRIIIVGVTPDRITPVAQWIAEPEEDDLDLSTARLPADEPGLVFKLPVEDDDPPLDISVVDGQQPERPGK
ncbi:MAG: flagellar biosynthetic protein FliO [Candidatus Adiutrix sp.]|jgi:flagellar biogenesis protein FliO|nr:flagellar biosynthetic protein FliO [Candidatus Adiutrix sp.]